VLNIEDTHVVSYSLKKLAAADLVAGAKRGKEVFFATTGPAALCLRYREVREACLMPGFSGERRRTCVWASWRERCAPCRAATTRRRARRLRFERTLPRHVIPAEAGIHGSPLPRGRQGRP
jgi:hypothetical protein